MASQAGRHRFESDPEIVKRFDQAQYVAGFAQFCLFEHASLITAQFPLADELSHIFRRQTKKTCPPFYLPPQLRT
jgi:hypothetical protein